MGRRLSFRLTSALSAEEELMARSYSIPLLLTSLLTTSISGSRST